MSDNTFVTDLSSATTGGQYSMPTISVREETLEKGESSLRQLSMAIQSSAGLPQYASQPAPPLIVEPAEPSQAQMLHMYLTVARRSQQPTVMENAFTLALRTQRTMVSATISSTMPTALKIKTCEIPLLKLFLEFGLRSPQWRALVVKLLNDNVEIGCGHLTVNRAKQVLKELAKKAGAKVLAAELAASTVERRMAAIILLGWLKHERAIEPLVTAYDQVSQCEKHLIVSTLEAHYLPKLAYYLKWCRSSSTPLADPLSALLEST